MEDNTLDKITPIDLVVPESRATPQFVLGLCLSGNKSTARTYRGAYEDFAGFFHAPTVLIALTTFIEMPIGDANAAVAGWRVNMQARGRQSSGVNTYLSAVRRFAKEAKRCGLVGWELDVDSARHKQYRDTAGPGHDNYKAMLGAATQLIQGSDTPKGRRDTAIMRLLYDVGLRRAEVASLDLADVDTERAWGGSERGAVAIVQKRDTESTWIGLPAPVMAAVQRWIVVRGKEPGPLFKNLDRAAQNDDRRLSDTSIYRMVVAYGVKAGVQRRVSPHRLRHGGATRAAEVTNGNAIEVRAWGRWKSLETAQRYVDNKADLQAQVAAKVSED
jgi:integrase/recombinase XerC